MIDTWNGPTPWDEAVKEGREGRPYLTGDLGAQIGYRAAMNSPEVRAMWAALVTRLTSSKRNSPQEISDVRAACAAYEAGLKEKP